MPKKLKKKRNDINSEGAHRPLREGKRRISPKRGKEMHREKTIFAEGSEESESGSITGTSGLTEKKAVLRNKDAGKKKDALGRSYCIPQFRNRKCFP